MTTEVAVMNKLGVALAADSAATVITRGTVKIYNTSKLFSLSKHEPIAAMIYGNAEFMGLPWETVIKLFSQRLGTACFETVHDYASEFVKFIENQPGIVSEAMQRGYMKSAFESYLDMISEDIDNLVKEKLDTKETVDTPLLRRLIGEILRHHKSELHKEADLSDFPKEDDVNILDQYQREFEDALDVSFEKLPLNTSHKKILQEMFVLFFHKLVVHNGISGVVIAGFGKTENYPVLINLTVDGMVSNHLRYTRVERKITPTMGAAIVPFAQMDMISMFVEGIDPRLEEILNYSLTELFTKYPQRLFELISQHVEKDISSLTQEVAQQAQNIGQEFIKTFTDYRRANFVRDIIESVRVLPLEELSGLAESLVSLTSLRRRMSQDYETVGGPVDVVVLSKGDGLVWIHRKRYYDSALNPGLI